MVVVAEVEPLYIKVFNSVIIAGGGAGGNDANHNNDSRLYSWANNRRH